MMPDREKVIKAFEICDNNEDGIVCKNCPYKEDKWNGAWEDETGKTCFQTLHADVLALLKKQQEEIDFLTVESGSNAELAEGYAELMKGLKEQIDTLKENFAHLSAMIAVQQEIVRCKDCKFGEPWGVLIGCGTAKGFGITHKPDWFCADGELKK